MLTAGFIDFLTNFHHQSEWLNVLLILPSLPNSFFLSWFSDVSVCVLINLYAFTCNIIIHASKQIHLNTYFIKGRVDLLTCCFVAKYNASSLLKEWSLQSVLQLVVNVVTIIVLACKWQDKANGNS